jgi:hypothetical protein
MEEGCLMCPDCQCLFLLLSRESRGGVYANAGPTSLPGPGSSYITGSPRSLAATMRRDSLEQGGYARYPSGGYEGPHSLPYSLQHNYQEGTLYQVNFPSLDLY